MLFRQKGITRIVLNKNLKNGKMDKMVYLSILFLIFTILKYAF
jgi:hypothetical protein